MPKAELIYSKRDMERTLDAQRKLEVENKRLTGELKTIKKDNASAAELRETIFGLTREPLDPPSWINETVPGKFSGVPVSFWSDFHWGERVFPEQVGGKNEFNRAIAIARLKKLCQVTIDLAKNHMTDPAYPGIIIALGGDIISGMIHEELRETNEGTLGACVEEVIEHLIAAITLMADEFGFVFIPCVVGNHGRITLKPRAKNRVQDNYDWLIYCALARHFKGDTRVQFLIPNEADCHFTVYGHRFMLTHGDTLGVKGGDGIIGSLGPIARGTIKVGRSEAQIGRDFDTLLIGHWHTYIPRGEAVPVIVNGALKGFDEYAHLMLRARYTRPSQALFFVHPKYGITAQWAMYLDKERKTDEARAAQWVSWETRGV